jgi:hypothetical protein
VELDIVNIISLSNVFENAAESGPKEPDNIGDNTPTVDRDIDGKRMNVAKLAILVNILTSKDPKNWYVFMHGGGGTMKTEVTRQQCKELEDNGDVPVQLVLERRYYHIVGHSILSSRQTCRKLFLQE